MPVSVFFFLSSAIAVQLACAMVESPMLPAPSLKDVKGQHDDSEHMAVEDGSQVADAHIFTAQSVREHLRDEVLSLNKWTFQGNIDSGDVENWIVLFCLEWYEPCQDFKPVFQELAHEWQEKMDDGDMLRTKVRFAHVDCTTQRVLCNEQNAHDYPRIVNYRGSVQRPLAFRRVRTLSDAVQQARSFLALRLLEKPVLVQLDTLEEEIDPWSFSHLSKLAGLRSLFHDDMIDLCLLLTACAAAAGLYATRGGDTKRACSVNHAPAAPHEEGMKAHKGTADLLPIEWASERQEIAL